MHKKTIHKKHHYRYIANQLKHFSIHLDGWYNMWHEHLDWDGYSNRSIELRQKHINYYLQLLDKVEEQTSNAKDYKFQSMIFIDSNDGGQDALFMNTENPNSDFPLKVENLEWIEELPRIFPPLDMKLYKVGRVSAEDGYDYFIQKIGVGLQIDSNSVQ